MRQDYGAPLRPGDWLYTRSEVANCTSRKRTRLGEGHFLTLLTSFYRHPPAGEDELIGASQYAFFFYEAEQGVGTPAARSSG